MKDMYLFNNRCLKPFSWDLGILMLSLVFLKPTHTEGERTINDKGKWVLCEHSEFLENPVSKTQKILFSHEVCGHLNIINIDSVLLSLPYGLPLQQSLAFVYVNYIFLCYLLVWDFYVIIWNTHPYKSHHPSQSDRKNKANQANQI